MITTNITIVALGAASYKYGGDMLDEGNSLAIDHNQGLVLAGTTYGGGADVVGFHGGRQDAWVAG